MNCVLVFRNLSAMTKSLRLTYACPGPDCGLTNRQLVTAETTELNCPECSWAKPVAGADLGDSGTPEHCLVCGCADLWKQKDFPQKLGLMMVGAGGLLSTIAWYYYRPLLAIGILMAFALVDLLLYALMGDTLVCYSCRSRHRPDEIDPEHPAFNLELAERYRQEALRLEEAGQTEQSN
jgi:hypothetical protein